MEVAETSREVRYFFFAHPEASQKLGRTQEFQITSNSQNKVLLSVVLLS